jgi:hypothetical protein
MNPRILFCAVPVSISPVPDVRLQAQSAGLFVNSRNHAGSGATTPPITWLSPPAGPQSNEGVAQAQNHIQYNFEKPRFKFRLPA